MSNPRQLVWRKGEKKRPLSLQRPCTCGTCRSVQPEGTVGYITGSDGRGKGFTVWIESEAVYSEVLKAFRLNKLQAHS